MRDQFAADFQIHVKIMSFMEAIFGHDYVMYTIEIHVIFGTVPPAVTNLVSKCDGKLDKNVFIVS